MAVKKEKKMYIFQGNRFKFKNEDGSFSEEYRKGNKVELTKKQLKPFKDLFIPCE